jgi:hypothetical protein
MSKTPLRTAMHNRSITHQSWLHKDGSLEIESRLLDTKAYDTRVGFGRELPTGEALHDMTVNIRVGTDTLIREIQLRMDATPFDICPEVICRFDSLRGASMGRGWNVMLSRRFARISGCRHLVDLLRGMGTVAFQSLPATAWTEEVLESYRDSCYAFRHDGPVVVRLRAETAVSTREITKRDIS